MSTTLVIGAGVVGLATARALARSGRQVIVVEAAHAIGTETSGRNSEVIHGGMYYDTNSLKATCCVEGRRMLYDFCDEYGVKYNRRGKLIVATSQDEKPGLQKIYEQSLRNGLTTERDKLTFLSREEARALEPQLECAAALLSPDTGVIDSHGYMLALQGDAERHGAVFAFNTPVVSGTKHKDSWVITTGGDTPTEIECELVVNCAGLMAQDVANQLAMPESHSLQIPPTYYAKGSYFKLEGTPSPFEHLVYPLPNEVGLGVHLTIDVGGQAKFGPDVEWVANATDYTVDPVRGDSFYEQVRKYWPDLPDKSLVADYSGIRPKTVPKGHTGPKQDFEIVGPQDHSLQGLVHLFGIESPGLTSSLAIAKRVLGKLS